MHVTEEELEKILKPKLEPVERSLNFNSDEYHAMLDLVAKFEETICLTFFI